MFTFAADRLSLPQIAKLWAEEISPTRTAAEMRLILEYAFWKGEFRAEGLSRLDMLRRLRRGPETDPATWTEEGCGPAFEHIASCWPYPAPPGRSGGPVTVMIVNYERALEDIELSRAEFMRWIDAKRYHRPAFWGPFPPAIKPTPGVPGGAP